MAGFEIYCPFAVLFSCHSSPQMVYSNTQLFSSALLLWVSRGNIHNTSVMRKIDHTKLRIVISES
jgi:hypothetical protein